MAPVPCRPSRASGSHLLPHRRQKEHGRAISDFLTAELAPAAAQP